MKPPDLSALRERAERSAEQASRIAEGVALRLYRQLYIRSEGRIGAKTLGVPGLLLTTTGRKSGARYTVALVYATDGDDLVLVGSNGGSDNSPDWVENLRKDPAVDLQIGRDHSTGTAEVVDRNDRRYERLWRIANANNRGRYYRYQSSTTRPIPVVLLRTS
jgi:F420H(2)-dependent quinone reductase